MVLNFKSIATGFGAIIIAGGLTLTGALADEAQDQTQAASEISEDAAEQTEVAERSNSCEGYNRESARFSLNVASVRDPRHTPCVSDSSTRIRRSSDD